MKGTLKKVKAIELVFDWNLWPRYEAESLDQTNIRRIKQAILAGIEIPPIVINKKDYRIADGFHRVKSVLSLYGDEAEIMANVVDFKNDAEIFLESARLNALHGLPLSPRDRAHVIFKAKHFKIPYPAIAQAIGMEVDKLKEFLRVRAAKSKTGETILLSGGALNLSGTVLTTHQEECVKGINGMKASANAKILLNELKSGAFVVTDSLLKNLIELKSEIDKVLAKVGV